LHHGAFLWSTNEFIKKAERELAVENSVFLQFVLILARHAEIDGIFSERLINLFAITINIQSCFKSEQ
jgi:hypothetical protein